MLTVKYQGIICEYQQGSATRFSRLHRQQPKTNKYNKYDLILSPISTSVSHGHLWEGLRKTVPIEMSKTVGAAWTSLSGGTRSSTARSSAILNGRSPSLVRVACQNLNKRLLSSSTTPLNKAEPWSTLKDYRYFLPFMTRWSDNDVYAHLNNVQYIHYVDSVVNEYLINHAHLSPTSQTSPIGLVVSSAFTYAAPLSYPNPVLAALSISKLGKSSVSYQCALFQTKDIVLAHDSHDIVKEGRGTFFDLEQAELHSEDGGENIQQDGLSGRFTLNVQVDVGREDVTKAKEGGQTPVAAGLREIKAAAKGSFIHVFVDPLTRKSVPIPERSRDALEKLLVRVE